MISTVSASSLYSKVKSSTRTRKLQKKHKNTETQKKINIQKIFTSLFRAPQRMPRKKKGTEDAAGSADVRSFFAATTPLRNITNTAASTQSASPPPLRTAPASRGLKFGQIHDSARAGASAAARKRITRRSSSPSSDGEEVQYSGVFGAVR
jgi:hypothetical protein